MTYSQLVKEKRIKQFKNNTKEVVSLIGTKEMNKKIETYLEKSPFASKQEIEDKIRNDELFAAFFAKDPLRQNIGEKVFCEYLNVRTLPQSGKNVVRFSTKGEIISSKELNCSKAADFYIGSYYITQKYTGENNGGAQDNQYEDVIRFLTLGSISHKVCACVDGWYWEQNGKRTELQKLFSANKNVIICSADDIKNGVINLE